MYVWKHEIERRFFEVLIVFVLIGFGERVTAVSDKQ